MNSVSGDLHIARGSGSSARQGAQPDQSPSPADLPQERLEPDQPAGKSQESETTKILRALEVGEITVEQAMAKLEALR
jgi:hypothetical protein